MGYSGTTRRAFQSDSMLLDRTFRRSPSFAPIYCLAVATGFSLCWLIIHFAVPQVPEHLAEFQKLVPPIVFQSQAAAFTAVLLINLLNVAFSRDSTCCSCNWLLVLVNFVALATHLLVSCNLTPVVLGPTGLYFHPLRYCCWTFSTPTLLVLVSSLSDISPRQLQIAVVSDVVMILTGLAAVWTVNMWQLVNTIVSFLTFIPVLWYMSLMFDSAIHATEDPSTRISLRVLSGTCMFVWSAFPTVWLLAFCHIITPEQEQTGLGLCDFVAKAIFSSQLWQGNVMTIQQRTEKALRAWQESNSMLIMHKLRKLLTARDVLVHSLSHELQTPIKGIVALTTDLLRAAEKNKSQATQQDHDKIHRTNMSTIRASAVCLLDIISSALDAVTNPMPQQQLTGELVRLQSLAAGVVHIVTPLLPGHIRLFNEIPPSLPAVDSNKRALMRVLLNMTGALIQNPLVTGRVALRATEEHDTVLVQVTALDVVLDEDCLQKLLYPFTPGAGHIISDMTGDTMASNPPLFLFLLRNFLASHAPLSATATPQNGTIFSFRLPIADMDDQSVSSTQTFDLILPSETDMQMVAEVQYALRNARTSTESADAHAQARRQLQAFINSNNSPGCSTPARDPHERSQSSVANPSVSNESYLDAEQDDDPVLAAWHEQHMASLLKKHTEGLSEDTQAPAASSSPESATRGQLSNASDECEARDRAGQAALNRQVEGMCAAGRETASEQVDMHGQVRRPTQPAAPVASDHGSGRAQQAAPVASDHSSGRAQQAAPGESDRSSERSSGPAQLAPAGMGGASDSMKATARASQLMQASTVKDPKHTGTSVDSQQTPHVGGQLRRSLEQVVATLRSSLEMVIGHSKPATHDSATEVHGATGAAAGHTTTTITATTPLTTSPAETSSATHSQACVCSTVSGSSGVSNESLRVSFDSRRSSLSKWRNDKASVGRRCPSRPSLDYKEGTMGFSARAPDSKVHRFWLATKPKLPHRHKHGVVQVLCVDDNIINQLIAEAMLKGQHWKVIKAMSGEQALDYVLNKAEVLPDMLLLDVMMPGINGFDVCSRLRQFYPSSVLPIMMLTTSMSENNVVEGLKCGADDYIAKPYKRAELTSRIRAHLRARDDIYDLHDHLSAWQMLHNMLPPSIKMKLKSGQAVVPERVDAVVLVVHICDLSNESALMPPSRLMIMLNQLIAAFGKICAAHGVQLVDFVGSGLTLLHILDKDSGPSVQDMVQVGVEILQRAQPLVWPSGKPLRLQAALHCGPATAGLLRQDVLKYILVGEAITLAEQLVQAVPPCGFFVSQPVVSQCPNTSIFTEEPVAHSPSGVACYLVKSPGWQAALDDISSHETWPLKHHTPSPPHAVHSSGMLQPDAASSPRIPATPAAEVMPGHTMPAALAAHSITQFLATSAALPSDFAAAAGQVPVNMTSSIAPGPPPGMSLSEIMRMMTEGPWRVPPCMSNVTTTTATSAAGAVPDSHAPLPAGALPADQPNIASDQSNASVEQSNITVDQSNSGNLPTGLVAPPPWMPTLLPPHPHTQALFPFLQLHSTSAELFDGAGAHSAILGQSGGRVSTDSNCTSDGTSSTGSTSTRNSVSLPPLATTAAGHLSRPQMGQIAQAVLQHQIVSVWQQLQQLTLQLQHVNSWLASSSPADQAAASTQQTAPPLQQVSAAFVPGMHTTLSQSHPLPCNLEQEQQHAIVSDGHQPQASSSQSQALVDAGDGSCSQPQPQPAGSAATSALTMPLSLNALSSSATALAYPSLQSTLPLTALQLQNRFLQATPTLAQPTLRPFPPTPTQTPTHTLTYTPTPTPTTSSGATVTQLTLAQAGTQAASRPTPTPTSQLGMNHTPQGSTHGPAPTQARSLAAPLRTPTSPAPSLQPPVTVKLTPPRADPLAGCTAGPSTAERHTLTTQSTVETPARNTFADRLLAYCNTVGSFQQTQGSATPGAGREPARSEGIGGAGVPEAGDAPDVDQGRATPGGAQREAGTVVAVVQEACQSGAKEGAGNITAGLQEPCQSGAKEGGGNFTTVVQERCQSDAAAGAASIGGAGPADTAIGIDGAEGSQQAVSHSVSQGDVSRVCVKKFGARDDCRSSSAGLGSVATHGAGVAAAEVMSQAFALSQQGVQHVRGGEPGSVGQAVGSKSADKEVVPDLVVKTGKEVVQESVRCGDVRDVDPDQQVGMDNKSSMLLSAHALQDTESGSSDQSAGSGQSSPDAPAAGAGPQQ